MKYLVDDTLQSICARIASLGLTAEEWSVRDDVDRFDLGRHRCSYSEGDKVGDKGVFLFEFPGPRDWKYTAELTLDDVLRIHEGRNREIEVAFKGGSHPEDQGMRRIETDPEVIVHAISDAINIYLRDVLIPRGVASKQAWEGEGSEELVRLKYEVANTVAAWWRVTWVNDNT